MAERGGGARGGSGEGDGDTVPSSILVLCILSKNGRKSKEKRPSHFACVPAAFVGEYRPVMQRYALQPFAVRFGKKAFFFTGPGAVAS